MGGERERRREGKHGEWGQGKGLAQWVQGGIDAPWRHMNGFGLQSAVGVDLRLVEHSVDTQNNYGEFKKKTHLCGSASHYIMPLEHQRRKFTARASLK